MTTLHAYHITVDMWHGRTESLEKAPDAETATDQFIDKLLSVFDVDDAAKLGVQKISVKQLPDAFCEAIK